MAEPAPPADRPMAKVADGFAIAVAVALPWSSSAVNVLAVLWLLALLPTLTAGDVRRELATAAGALPVALVLFGAFGMLWADVAWPERLGGLDSFLKLLLLPLLLMQFRRSARGSWVLAGYLVSCTLLLALSSASLLWPHVAPSTENAGVPVKSAATQCTEFILCAFALLFLAVNLLRTRPAIAAALAALAVAFLVNVYIVAIDSTPAVVSLLTAASFVALAVLLAVKTLTRRNLLLLLTAVAAVCVVTWIAAPQLRTGITTAWNGIQAEPGRWLGSRPGFWQKSLTFIADRPLFGHGTGSIQALYARSAAGPGQATLTINPHQQSLAIGMQLGLAGMAVLWAMWVAHLMLFRGDTLPAGIGLMVVTQTAVGSFAESNLFDFTLGWTYVFGVGVAGGTIHRLALGKTDFNQSYVRDGGAANEHCGRARG